MLKLHITPELIQEVVSKLIWIPIYRMIQDENTRLLNLLKELHKRVIWQNESVEVVLDATLRSRNWLSNDKIQTRSF